MLLRILNTILLKVLILAQRLDEVDKLAHSTIYGDPGTKYCYLHTIETIYNVSIRG